MAADLQARARLQVKELSAVLTFVAQNHQLKRASDAGPQP